MKVLVTGGAGGVGAAIVERLARAGDEVTVIGRTAGVSVVGARYRQCDVTDIDALLPAVRGMDAVVHLAAIPSPESHGPQEIFRVNCCGTFNVYEAAARAGLHRVVTASSINALGYNFGIKAFTLPSLPVDERVPGICTDGYSFSKQVTERIADYAWRRDGISGTCLRLPWVAPADRSAREPVLKHAAECRASWDALLGLSEDKRGERVRGWIAIHDSFRARRFTENPEIAKTYTLPDPLMLGRTDFWTRIDERDSAQAVERSLRAEYEGSHPLFVNDIHNITGLPSVALARLFFPGAAARAEEMPGTATLVAIGAARRLIGFDPEFSVGRWFTSA